MKLLFKYKFYYLSFIVLGILIYFPIFSNGFVWDDIEYILKYEPIHSLQPSIFYDNVFNTGAFYRQIPALYFSFMYTVFQDNPFPYHLFQLTMHIICSALLFTLFRNYLHKTVAFFCSILFLIHPINVESVAWIASTQNQLVLITGLSSLLIIHKNKLINTDFYLLGLLLFLCLLTYETGIFFFILILYYLFTNKSKYLKKTIAIQLAIVGTYILLRITNGAMDFTNFNDHPFVSMTLLEKFLTVPSILFYYLQHLLFPWDLAIWQYWIIKEISFAKVLLPSILIIYFGYIYIIYLRRRKGKDKKVLYFFTLWFSLGILPLLHIVSPDMTVSDRWFYLPFIGLLGIVGYLISKYALQYNKIFMILCLIILCLFAVRSHYRTYDWKDNYSLFLHDIKYQPQNVYMNYSLGTFYFEDNKFSQAIPYFEEVSSQTQKFKYVQFVLGASYENIGEYDNAIKYYTSAILLNRIPSEDSPVDVYVLTTRIMREQKQYNDIIMLLNDDVVEKSQFKNLLLFIRGEAYFNSKEYKKAFKDINYVYTFTQEKMVKDLYDKVKNLQNEN